MTTERFPADPDLLALIRGIRLIAFDFDGVFTDNTVFVFEDGREAIRCTRADGIGLRKLDRLGVTNLIVSTETNPVVAERAKKIEIECIQNCPDKRVELEHLSAERGVPLERMAFVGNDLNDRSALEAVGLPIVVADAHPDVHDLARFRTIAPGGHGAVREICDLFEFAHQQIGSEAG